MIPQIRRILYTTDLSENARYAFGYAAALANRHQAQIIVLHVLEDIPHSAAARLKSVLGREKFDEILDDSLKTHLKEVHTRLDQFCEDMDGQLEGCTFIIEQIIVKQGEPVEEILNQVEYRNCDLIVMGSRGQSRMPDVMLGSTARRVVRRSEKPVMIIRMPEEE